MEIENVVSVRQLAEACPAFTEASVRWWIFNAETNGLNSALVRVGRRVLIDVPEFERWLEAGRAADVRTVPFREVG